MIPSFKGPIALQTLLKVFLDTRMLFLFVFFTSD